MLRAVREITLTSHPYTVDWGTYQVGEYVVDYVASALPPELPIIVQGQSKKYPHTTMEFRWDRIDVEKQGMITLFGSIFYENLVATTLTEEEIRIEMDELLDGGLLVVAVVGGALEDSDLTLPNGERLWTLRTVKDVERIMLQHDYPNEDELEYIVWKEWSMGDVFIC